MRASPHPYTAVLSVPWAAAIAGAVALSPVLSVAAVGGLYPVQRSLPRIASFGLLGLAVLLLLAAWLGALRWAAAGGARFAARTAHPWRATFATGGLGGAVGGALASGVQYAAPALGPRLADAPIAVGASGGVAAGAVAGIQFVRLSWAGAGRVRRGVA